MLPSVRRLLVSEVAFASLVAMVLLSEAVPFFGWLLNPHSTAGGIGLLALILAVLSVLVVLLASLPSAGKALLRDSAERTPFQVAVVLLGCLLIPAIVAWFAGIFHH